MRTSVAAWTIPSFWSPKISPVTVPVAPVPVVPVNEKVKLSAMASAAKQGHRCNCHQKRASHMVQSSVMRRNTGVRGDGANTAGKITFSQFFTVFSHEGGKLPGNGRKKIVPRGAPTHDALAIGVKAPMFSVSRRNADGSIPVRKAAQPHVRGAAAGAIAEPWVMVYGGGFSHGP